VNVKIWKKILLLIVALVVLNGSALADRLPSQVPENQVFSIDTIIDCVGMVSDSSSISWVLDDQNLTTYSADKVGTVAGYTTLTNTQLEELKAMGVSVTYDSTTHEISSIDFPSDMYSTVLPTDIAQSSGVSTVGALYSAITAGSTADEYYGYTTTDKGSIHDSKLNPTESIMIMTWSDSIRTNGGKLSLSKSINFDSKNKVSGMSNLETEKVLTYESTEGSHLTGAESYSLDVAGNYEKTADTIRCVFASSSSDYLPAFCNVVKAKSELININSAQISTKGSVRSVAASANVPAGLSYEIAVTPNSNSGSGFADGTVKTFFGGSIMEARGKNQEPSATNSWKDSSSVSGGIKNFQKTFNYESGFSS